MAKVACYLQSYFYFYLMSNQCYLTDEENSQPKHMRASQVQLKRASLLLKKMCSTWLDTGEMCHEAQCSQSQQSRGGLVKKG